MLVMKNFPFHEPLLFQTTSEYIAQVAKSYGVDRNTNKPFSFMDISSKIGEDAALLMLSMSSNPNCSIVGLETILEIMYAIAGADQISVAELDYEQNSTRPLDFVLGTKGFLREDFDNYQHLTCGFRLTPEARYKKSAMRDGARGILSLDLEISMYITISIPETEFSGKICESIEVANVVVEVDGPAHLQDEKVRSDKERDSMVQGLGKTVFRIQTPYQQTGLQSSKVNKEMFEELVKRQIEDIKEHLRQLMFRQFSVSDLINTALNCEKRLTSTLN